MRKLSLLVCAWTLTTLAVGCSETPPPPAPTTAETPTAPPTSGKRVGKDKPVGMLGPPGT